MLMKQHNPVILVLTQEEDGHIPPVEKALHDRGANMLRFNLADFPESIQLAALIQNQCWYGTLDYQGRRINLEDIQSIWWRRPQAYQAPATYPTEVREFIGQEAYRGFLGVLQGTIGQKKPF